MVDHKSKLAAAITWMMTVLLLLFVLDANRGVFEMARIKNPYWELRSLRIGESSSLEIDDLHRSYARIDKKFIPVGWYIVWSDGQEEVVLDDNVPSTDEALANYRNQ